MTVGEPWANTQPPTQLVFIGARGAIDRDKIASLFDVERVPS